MAVKVEIPVKLTASATFPFAIELMKLEIFPPGQAATMIIPSAMVGDGLRSITNKKVNAGNKNVWLTYPVMAGFGFFIRFVKCSNLISSATPNITNARVIFKNNRPDGEKLSLT